MSQMRALCVTDTKEFKQPSSQSFFTKRSSFFRMVYRDLRFFIFYGEMSISMHFFRKLNTMNGYLCQYNDKEVAVSKL